MGVGMGGKGSEDEECCGVCCTLFSDDFDRANDPSLGGSWQETGTWDLFGSSARCTSQNARALVGSLPDSNWLRLTSNVSGDAGDRLVLILNYLDPGNFSGLFITIGELGSARLFVAEGGLIVRSDDRDISSNPGVSVELMICQGENGDLHGSIIGPGMFGPIIEFFQLRNTSPAGMQFGIGTLLVTSGDTVCNARFYDVTLERVSSDCEECINCASCPEGSANTLWIDATWSDAGLADRNGLFELRRFAEFPCCWASPISLVSNDPWYFASFRPQTGQDAPGSIVIGSIGLHAYTHFVKAVDACIIDEGSPIELTKDDFIPGPPGAGGVFSNCFADAFPFGYPSSSLTPPGTVSLQVWSDP